MSFDLHINWRGPLSSCNYDCAYCPFAKRISSREQLAADEAALARFAAWVGTCRRRVSILVTPWGEGLIRPYYQRALTELSHRANVSAVAIQTNLSCRLEWAARANLDTLGLWTTYHPSQVALERFLERCAELDAIGVRYSVGVVGLREHLDAIERLRARLPSEVYLWINAFKRGGPDYYDSATRERLATIDPLFPISAEPQASLAQRCAAGATSIFVDGDGLVRRCHFVSTPLGNLYDDALEDLLGERPCPEQACRCFIGYVHLERLALRPAFGEGLAARMLPTRHRLLPSISADARQPTDLPG